DEGGGHRPSVYLFKVNAAQIRDSALRTQYAKKPNPARLNRVLRRFCQTGTAQCNATETGCAYPSLERMCRNCAGGTPALKNSRVNHSPGPSSATSMT